MNIKFRYFDVSSHHYSALFWHKCFEFWRNLLRINCFKLPNKRQLSYMIHLFLLPALLTLSKFLLSRITWYFVPILWSIFTLVFPNDFLICFTCTDWFAVSSWGRNYIGFYNLFFWASALNKLSVPSHFFMIIYVLDCIVCSSGEVLFG